MGSLVSLIHQGRKATITTTDSFYGSFICNSFYLSTRFNWSHGQSDTKVRFNQ